MRELVNVSPSVWAHGELNLTPVGHSNTSVLPLGLCTFGG